MQKNPVLRRSVVITQSSLGRNQRPFYELLRYFE
jgi:hypothetical protein